MKNLIAATFAKKTQREWTKVFSSLDACVTPVLEFTDAADDNHNQFRKSFLVSKSTGLTEPSAAPKLSRTPAKENLQFPFIGEHTKVILEEEGFSNKEICSLVKKGAVEILSATSKL